MELPFRSNCYYKHINSMDVCIQVVKIRYIGDKSVTLIVNIWNLGYTGNPWLINTQKNYIISSEQYGNYKQLSSEELSTPRVING